MAGFVDDHEEALFHVSPSDNVYSYFMFVTPTEQKKEGGSMTWDTLMAYILVTLNFVMQGLLLYTIYNEVVVANLDWQGSIMRYDNKDWALFSPPPEGCNDGGSLCFLENNTFSCAPPSVQLTGRWAELDTDGDGIWTREEVQKARKTLQCKYVVDPEFVFDVFVKFLLAREKIIWIHPDLRAGKAIHKPYFTYAAGDVIMCGYRNEKMCPNLLKRGVFHAPLKYETAPRVGTTIDTALKYCTEMLKPGGMCEKTLPSTYGVWKIESANQCGAQSFEKMVYEHPKSGVKKSMLTVDYEANELFALSKTTIFQVYKTIIIGLWCLQMLQDLKDITISMTWVMRFPGAEEFGDEAVKEEKDADDNTKYIIQGITSGHRITVGLMNVGRLILASVLLVVGISYLLRGTDYIGLLMDAVALVFIIEIANILYGQVLRPEIRDQCESLDAMEVPMYGIKWLNERQAIVDVIQLIAIVIVTVAIMYNYRTGTVEPLSDALECACVSRGDKCHEAHRFSYDFWYKYWKEDVPAVFAALDELKASAPALLETAKDATANLLMKGRQMLPQSEMAEFARFVNWKQHVM
jgi:hypothetical protein